MVAKGKDASDLFPAVVKNVVSKNLEVRTFFLLPKAAWTDIKWYNVYICAVKLFLFNKVFLWT